MSTRCQVEFYDAFILGGKTTNRLQARVYQHCDGYPSNMIPALRYLESVLGNCSIYGTRTNDPEFAAAEFVNQFRLASDVKMKEGEYSKKLKAGYATKGNVYVTQNRHGDLSYLYKVYCYDTGWVIDIFEPARTDSVRTGRFKCVSTQFNVATGAESGKQ